MTDYSKSYIAAVRDFQQARIRATVEEFFARLTGKTTDLLSYDEVREKLKATGSSRRELRDIPLDAIIGSVGRYSDFTRSFRPRRDMDKERWAGVEMKMVGQEGLPPIEVYQLGEAYFVIDGNHRVSVARQMEAQYIEAYVTEVKTKVPLTPDANPDEIILKARYLDFLERTKLDQLRPEAQLLVSVPGQYRILEQHIELHRYIMSAQQQRDVPFEEAIVNWYDNVYSVIVEIIREQNIVEDFSGRTETDIYLWVSDYRAMLRDALAWGIKPDEIETEATSPPKSRLQQVFPRGIAEVLGIITPEELMTDPIAGDWRREHLIREHLQKPTRRPFRLFTNILVPVNGQEVGWFALYQALGIARREGGRLVGLHVVPDEADKNSEAVQDIKAKFNRRCAKTGIAGRMVVEAGNVTDKIYERSRWSDLIVLRLIYPPSPQPLARLGSGFHSLVRRCRRPILVVPRNFVYPLDRVLLAFDGSQKATEALYIAAYLADRWETPLVVLTLAQKHIAQDTLQAAQDYLQQFDVKATYLTKEGPVAKTIVETAEAYGSNLIVMGGYGHNPVVEIVLGSAVDEVLRTSRLPTLICR